MKNEEFIRIEKLAFQPGHRMRLTFSDGKTHVVDYKPYLRGGPIGEPLHDEQFFSQAALIQNGRALEWPNGYDADWLYTLPTVDEYAAKPNVAAGKLGNNKTRDSKAKLLIQFEQLSEKEKIEFIQLLFNRYPEIGKAS